MDILNSGEKINTYMVLGSIIQGDCKDYLLSCFECLVHLIPRSFLFS